jgi:hypothetical protein
MGRHATVDDEDYEDDPEEPDESDIEDGRDEDDEAGGATDECPYCGADVYEFAEKCPSCGQYLSKEDAPPRSGHPRWVVITAIVLLVPMLYAILKWWL